MCGISLFPSVVEVQALVTAMGRVLVSSENFYWSEVAPSESGKTIAAEANTIYLGSFHASAYNGNGDIDNDNLEIRITDANDNLRRLDKTYQEAGGGNSGIGLVSNQVYIPKTVFKTLTIACDSGSVYVSGEVFARKIVLAPV